jgi:hypothetical protein
MTTIGVRAFAYCSALEGITVADDNKNYKSVDNCLLTKDGKTLMAGCKNSVIPEGITSIEGSAFADCAGLTGDLIIPNSVTTIGLAAFFGCSNLESITINLSASEGIPVLDYNVFNNCDALNSIYVPEDSVSAYRNASNWSAHSDKIKAIETPPIE